MVRKRRKATRKDTEIWDQKRFFSSRRKDINMFIYGGNRDSREGIVDAGQERDAPCLKFCSLFGLTYEVL